MIFTKPWLWLFGARAALEYAFGTLHLEGGFPPFAPPCQASGHACGRPPLDSEQASAGSPGPGEVARSRLASLGFALGVPKGLHRC